MLNQNHYSGRKLRGAWLRAGSGLALTGLLMVLAACGGSSSSSGGGGGGGNGSPGGTSGLTVPTAGLPVAKSVGKGEAA
jgi:hypothetical protein